MPSEPQELLTQAAGSESRDRGACELIAQALRAGHVTRLRVTGTSMVPAIWPGAILRVSPSPQTSITTGKVVVVLRDGRLFAHRVVGRSGDHLITRGDAVSDCDPPVAASEVLGVVTGIIHHNGSGPDGTGFQPVMPPSIGQRIVAFAVRRSELIYRIVLKWHGLFSYPPHISLRHEANVKATS